MKITFGQLSLAFLLLSLFTGFFVGYHYEVATPFVSTVAIDSILPFGVLWRSMHFWTSQAFFISLLIHLYETRKSVLERAPKGIKIQWSILTLILPVSLFALFSGYCLRFDSTGQAASSISENLLLGTPYIGVYLNKFLLDISKEGLNRVYVVHIFFGFICWLTATWYHLKRVKIPYAVFLFTLVLTVIFCVFIRAPLDLATWHSHLIKGPWFFLGIQELLRYFDSTVAGVIFPAVPVVLIGIYPWVQKRVLLNFFLILWTSMYGIVSIISLLR